MLVVPLNKDPMESLIKSKLDWQRLDTIYNNVSAKMQHLIQEHGISGVYQIVRTEHKTEELLTKDIGYIGSSKNIFGRVYCVKINKNHTGGAFIKRNEIPFEEVWVRFLFTEPGKEKDLEALLHNKMKQKFGYTFSWREASGGTDGHLTRLYEMIDKLSSREDAENIYGYVKQRCIDLYIDSLGSEKE
jgi:hypothetical protein